MQVPPGTSVHLSGMALMGERKVEVAAGAGPTVHVDAYALMGSVKVTVGDGEVQQSAPGRVTHAALAHRSAEVGRRPQGLLAGAGRRLAGLAVPLAVLGGVVVAGPDSSAVFGSSVEQVAAGAEPVRVSTLFGSVTVVVPDGARVDTSGMVVFGSLDCDAACDATSGEVIEVRGLGGFGSIEVLTRSEHEAAQEAERLEEIADERDDEDDD